MTHIEQLREQITNTLIANECALDHVTGGAPAAKEIPIPGTERVMYIGRRADVERLLATAAGEQAEPLSDERIIDLAQLEGDETSHGFIFNKDSGFSVISFARAIERELRAVPSAAAPAGFDERERFIWQMGYNAAAPASPEQVQAEPIAMVSADELRDIQSCRMGVPVRGAGWRKDQTIALYLAAPIAAAPAASSLILDVRDMVNRFLGWPMPDSLSARIAPNITRPIGTHVMNADEARAMFEHCVQPIAPRPTDDDLWDATLRDRDTYLEWADKLAEAIAKHFGAYIGEHSNMNCPWAEALDVIEGAAPAAEEVQPIPAGWKLVPMQPTWTMTVAGKMEANRHHFGETQIAAVYTHMLAAAPAAPTDA